MITKLKKSKLSDQDEKVLTLCDRYVFSIVASALYNTEPVHWREYHSVSTRQFAAYPRKPKPKKPKK